MLFRSQKGETLPVADLSASFRRAVVNMLAENFLLAANDLGYQTLVTAGGVSANSELRSRLETECKKSGRRLFMPPLSLCGDNGAMVGAQGFYEFQAGNLADAKLNAVASLPIDLRK